MTQFSQCLFAIFVFALNAYIHSRLFGLWGGIISKLVLNSFSFFRIDSLDFFFIWGFVETIFSIFFVFHKIFWIGGDLFPGFLAFRMYDNVLNYEVDVPAETFLQSYNLQGVETREQGI